MTVLAGGVTWEELAAPGHSMAPTLLFVSAGADSGGFVTFTRENFVTVQTHRWRNPTAVQTQVPWVEALAGGG